MNWRGRRFAPGGGSTLSSFEIYNYNLLKDRPARNGHTFLPLFTTFIFLFEASQN
jgi:hypothetical protein